jgi:hypothetical protein
LHNYATGLFVFFLLKLFRRLMWSLIFSAVMGAAFTLPGKAHAAICPQTHFIEA